MRFLAPILVHQLGTPLPYRRQLRDFFREPFDVIHYNNVSLMGAPAIFRYGKGVKVATLHDYWQLCPLSTLFRYRKRVCEAEKPPCVRCCILAGKPPQWWRLTGKLHRAIEQVALFFANSEFVQQMHVSRGFPRPIVHLPSMTPPAMETSEPQPQAEPPYPEPYFFFAGRLERTKGVQDVISAYRRWSGRAHFLVAGDGTYRRALERLAAGNGKVRFLGYIPQAEVQRYYRHALAAIVPSIWWEPLSLVCLDALRIGTPVIARDIAGPGELVRKSNAGLLYTTEVELLAALDQMERASPEARRVMGRNGIEYATREHSPQTHVERYLGHIRSLQQQKALTSEARGPE